MYSRGWKTGLVGILLGLSLSAPAQEVRVVKWPVVQQLLDQKSDTTYVLNFWATWCKPCLAELPAFEQANAAYRGKKVKLLLISLDFATQLKSRVLPFVKARRLTCPVWLLDETDQNAFIDRVDPAWSGGLPATLLINPGRGRRKLLEKPLNFNELRVELSRFL